MLFQSFRELFFELSPWIILLPTFMALRLAWRENAHELKPLLGYLLLSLITQVVSFLLWRNSMNNLPLLHIYTLAEFILLFWFYMIIFGKGISAALPVITACAVSVFLVIDSLALESIWGFNTLGRSIEAFIFILLALAWFLKMIKNEFSSANVNSLKYMNAGLLIYFSGSIVLFSFSGLTARLTKALALNVWSIHTLLLVLLYVLLTMGLLKWKTN